ncbi:MAG: ThuA domain-containing protein [Saprospiraceae bacterium]|nr:ThuA domain-containing protein [Saprospiraceae bacterium]
MIKRTVVVWCKYVFLCSILFSATLIHAQGPLKALIIDGENNHGFWPMTTMMIKDYLEQTGMFTVDINRTAFTWQGGAYDKSIGLDDITVLLDKYPLEGHSDTKPVKEPKPDPNFAPNFSAYDVVISNLGWKASTWKDDVRAALESYVENGGGFIIVHAANNSFGDWLEYNRMIGVGGWGGRAKDYGYYAYYDTDGKMVRDDTEGSCGSHGPQSEFLITSRAPDHPIMRGLPRQWMHTKDELYERLRGPAESMTILATAFSDASLNDPSSKKLGRTGRHEPMLMALEYGKGRVFHTALGHMDYSMECVGFIITLQRAAEWVATGKVTQALPSDFPTKTQISKRDWKGRVN